MYSRQAQVVRTGDRRTIRTTARGYEVLRDPALNKGTAFSADERDALLLNGLLPPVITSELEPQLDRAYAAYHAAPSDLQKHIYMWRLHDNNETLFYALLQRHMLEMLPVVYDPVVGEAIENYSEVFTRPRGVFLSIDDPDGVEARLAAVGAGPDDIDLLVASDAEEILGIGDWGANGVDISIGKLAVYTAAAGVDPHRVVPVILDVGTDNAKLLNDPEYIGYRHGRIRGQQYDDFINAYVEAAKKLFPKAMLHWEDFGSTNARRILDRYRDEVPTFNDDMQGTGAIVMSGLFNAVQLSGTAWRDQRVVVLGGGTAGCGIADQIRDQIERDGVSKEEATRRVWIVDLPGLLTTDMSDGLLDYQRPYARPADEVAGLRRTPCAADRTAETRWPAMAALRAAAAGRDGIIDLATTVEAAKPTILIGTSTTPGMFTEEIVKTMAALDRAPDHLPALEPDHPARGDAGASAHVDRGQGARRHRRSVRRRRAGRDHVPDRPGQQRRAVPGFWLRCDRVTRVEGDRRDDPGGGAGGRRRGRSLDPRRFAAAVQCGPADDLEHRRGRGCADGDHAGAGACGTRRSGRGGARGGLVARLQPRRSGLAR